MSTKNIQPITKNGNYKWSNDSQVMKKVIRIAIKPRFVEFSCLLDQIYSNKCWFSTCNSIQSVLCIV